MQYFLIKDHMRKLLEIWRTYFYIQPFNAIGKIICDAIKIKVMIKKDLETI